VGYNLTDGGDRGLGHTVSAAVREKLSKERIGIPLTKNIGFLL